MRILLGTTLMAMAVLLPFGAQAKASPIIYDSMWASTANGSGDGAFNMFSNALNANGANGPFYFQIQTAGGSGDPLYLTGFAASTVLDAGSVPEPAFAIPTLAMLLGIVVSPGNRNRSQV